MKQGKRKPNRRGYGGGGQRTQAPVDHYKQTDTIPDYKEVLILKRFLSDRGKILPQKYTGLNSSNQRKLAVEIKKARYMGLLPYTDRHAI